ncbi:hypothetical protein [Bifidobacterium oedipodis]|uniref:Uncharacterized protein n=1 Tax=Bifidobacterium oedipodis TaxID=2675322 RepID=A0A7Y0EPC2_9BIFI|nr:hypothetical protein [Bifidobacterium sp. DSM 109957]NMM93924.1 hypothetical protein [Bifidobacterium sp. DSM 109957]
MENMLVAGTLIAVFFCLIGSGVCWVMSLVFYWLFDNDDLSNRLEAATGIFLAALVPVLGIAMMVGIAASILAEMN